MTSRSETPAITAGAGNSPEGKASKGTVESVTTAEARGILERRIGYAISPLTFLYWLEREYIYHIRVGSKLLIPRFVIEGFCKRRLRGEKLYGGV